MKATLKVQRLPVASRLSYVSMHACANSGAAGGHELVEDSAGSDLATFRCLKCSCIGERGVLEAVECAPKAENPVNITALEGKGEGDNGNLALALMEEELMLLLQQEETLSLEAMSLQEVLVNAEEDIKDKAIAAAMAEEEIVLQQLRLEEEAMQRMLLEAAQDSAAMPPPPLPVKVKASTPAATTPEVAQEQPVITALCSRLGQMLPESEVTTRRPNPWRLPTSQV